MTDLEGDDYWRPSPFEVATSWVHGAVSAGEGGDSCTGSPRRALESLMLKALVRQPCYVAFSGGRDSSAILAVATDVARRHGLPMPVPVTELYPGIPESDESEWQKMVMSHLRLKDWVRLEFPDGNDLLGVEAQHSLQSRGLVWPVALHVKPVVLRHLGGGGSFVTGEGGDEALGRRRGAHVSRLWRRGVRQLRAADLRSAGSTVAPRAYRVWRQRARLDAAKMQPWLRAETQSRHHRLLAADLTREPLSTTGSLEWLLTRRAVAMASHNYAVLAAEHGLVLHEPFLEPSFICSLSRAAGTWGYASRTDAMRALFADLLPEAILSRRSKAYFNRAFMGQATRDFAQRWDGDGLDPTLVDVEVLREEWLSPFPSAISTPLLHAAWLATTPAHQDGAG
jgi:asparagine synthetase B (glutamine-hydrolysing)